METARYIAGYIIVIVFPLALRVSQYRSRCMHRYDMAFQGYSSITFP